MPDNVAILSTAVQILADHGTEVTQIAGWKGREAREDIECVPEAIAVHHTGDVSTPIAIIRDGRRDLPGPLAHFLVGQSGRTYLIASGYTNNVGNGGYDNFQLAKAGKLTAQVRPPASDGTWSANRRVWGIEADGTGDWPPIVRQHVIEVCAALHIAEGWTNGARVMGHDEFTRRKPGDPGDDMGGVRAAVLAKIAEWTATAPQPEPQPEPEPTVKVPAALDVDGKDGPLTWAAAQWLLNQYGEKLAITGKADEPTRRALQRWLGVDDDSVLGPVSTKRLQWAVDAVQDGQWGSGTTTRFQTMLNAYIAAVANRVTFTGEHHTFTAGEANLWDPRFGGSDRPVTEAKKVRRTIGGTLLFLTESTRADRAAIQDRFPDAMWCWVAPGGSVAVAANMTRLWPVAPGEIHKRMASFGDGYHGAIAVRFESMRNGRPVDAIATHPRPGSVASDRQRRADVAATHDLAQDVPTLIGADWNLNADGLMPGYVRATPDGDTLDKPGVQRIDAIFMNDQVSSDGGVILDAGPLFDHSFTKALVTITATNISTL